MRQIAAGTIAAKRHLSLARVLALSFREHHPDIPFFLLLADEGDDRFDPAAEPFEMLRLHDLSIPNLPRFSFQYRQQELTYATTPYLLAHLLERGFTGACFFKQESLVLDDLSPILERLGRHSILLTPHLLKPLAGHDRHQRELNIIQSGIYNVGFLGVSKTATARLFLEWWQDRLYHFCRHDVSRGMHYEQRWLDLVPAFFEDVHIVRDPGLNVGHWNLPERALAQQDHRFVVEGETCRFFRFSGFDPERPHEVTRYSSRLTMAELGPAASVFARYLELLENAGYNETKTWPYAYDRFDNGVQIPELVRELYTSLGDEVARFGDPFRTAQPDSFFNWLREPAQTNGSPLTLAPLLRAIYERRPDVQAAYPDPNGVDREGFRVWIENSAAAEHGISPELLTASSRNG
jgi:hypothetical protein